MAAHELGHCERYLAGAFARPPAGFSATDTVSGPPVGAGAAAGADAGADAPRAYAWSQALRREEGYADLIGLAWIRHRHPQLYPRLHAWLVAERSSAPVRWV